MIYRTLLLATAGLAVGAAQAHAADADVYTLGELVVTAKTASGETIGGSVVTGETLRTYSKQTVDQALALVPGTNASNTGGSRNERLVYVRGFDRFQTTLSIDGVRVFLPADNRIDFARFLTTDLAEVQVSKGYVSVLDGPGGAINLVTVKPSRPVEADAQVAAFFNRRVADEAFLASGRLGGRFENGVYWQVSGAYNDRDHFTLSKNYKPTALEDGGTRDNSQSEDWRINLKAGWQPNDTDEYSINYTRSEGEKNAPYSVRDAANTRFWSWPYWDIDSLAFLGRTQLTDRLTLKTRLYRNTFDNLLSAFDSNTQSTQTLPRAFDSYYNDHATGGNVELDWSISGTSRLKGVFYARQDVHHERQDGFVRVPPSPINPSANAALLRAAANQRRVHLLGGRRILDQPVGRPRTGGRRLLRLDRAEDRQRRQRAGHRHDDRQLGHQLPARELPAEGQPSPERPGRGALPSGRHHQAARQRLQPGPLPDRVRELQLADGHGDP